MTERHKYLIDKLNGHTEFEEVIVYDNPNKDEVVFMFDEPKTKDRVDMFTKLMDKYNYEYNMLQRKQKLDKITSKWKKN